MQLLNEWPVPDGRENPFTEDALSVSEASANSAVDLFELVGLYLQHIGGATAIMKVTVSNAGYDLRITGAGDEDVLAPEGPDYNAIDFAEAAYYWKAGEVRKFVVTNDGLFYEVENPEGLPLPGVQIDREKRRELQNAEPDQD